MIFYLPLDDRPCNECWPQEIFRHELIKKHDEICVLKREDFIFDAQNCLTGQGECRRLILSVDALCYGSLLASRENGASLDEAYNYLNAAGKAKRQFPGLQINAFSVIMRASVSALCEGDLDTYHNMSLYSYYAGKSAEETGAQAHKDARTAEQYKNQIDPGIIKKYHAVRKRNHEINMACVRLVHEGVLDSLLLLQEDAPIYGFQKAEQRELTSLIRALGVQDRVYLHNGADEGGMMACARFWASESTQIQLFYSHGQGDFTALYEDRPFRENLADCMRYLNMENADAQTVLVIHDPSKGVQYEANDQEAHPDDADHTLRLTEELIKAGKRVYLLDLAYANGGSIPLVYGLKERKLAFGLWGYAAWNTAGNSLGTILSQIIADKSERCPNSEFTWKRLLEDMLYQSILRSEASALLKQAGDDPMHLSNKTKAEELLSKLLYDRLKAEKWPVGNESEVAWDHQAGELTEQKRRPPFVCRINLPWGRLFEADIVLNAIH